MVDLEKLYFSPAERSEIVLSLTSVPVVPPLFSVQLIIASLSLFAVMWLPCLHDALSPLGIYTWFLSLKAAVGARVFSRLARTWKINLTVPSGSASWHISAIHLHTSSIRDTLFSVLASIPHSLSGSHLAAANYPSSGQFFKPKGKKTHMPSVCVALFASCLCREKTCQRLLGSAWSNSSVVRAFLMTSKVPGSSPDGSGVLFSFQAVHFPD